MSKLSLGEKISKGITLTLAFTMGSTTAAQVAMPVSVYAQESNNTTTIQHEVKKFSDVATAHWAHDSIQWGVQNKIISGFPDETYRPTQPIKEEQFATILAKYVFKDKNLQNSSEGGWADNYYSELLKYSLPFSGYSNKANREAQLTRGQIARLIAAKNGFNLDERQAIYYMYENDISYGVISGQLSFESYGKDQAVKREQIPAFMQRLESTGHTTFMGKPSPVTDPTQIEGITGVPKDNTVITDDMFDDLAEEKGIVTPAPTGVGTFENPLVYSGDELLELRQYLNGEGLNDLGGSIVNIDGVLIPAVPQITGYDQGEILATRYTTGASLGYKDRDTFFKVVDTWRGSLLDGRQVDLIHEFESKWIGTKANSGIKLVKGSKHDMVLSANYRQLNVTVYPKGYADGFGFTVIQ